MMKSKVSKDSIHLDNCEECQKGIDTMFLNFANNDQGQRIIKACELVIWGDYIWSIY